MGLKLNEYQNFITNGEVGYQQNFALYNKYLSYSTSALQKVRN